MKANQHIDELLNGYVDGELTSRQSSELEQLLQHYPELRSKLDSVKNVSRLVRTLPPMDAPNDMAEQVREVLERRILLGDNVTETVLKPRQMLLQKLKSVAAVIGLMAALSVIVYSIVAPPKRSTDAVSVDHQDRSGYRAQPIRGRLELQSTVSARIDNLLMRSIQSYGLGPFVEKETADDVSVYVLRCPAGAVDPLLSDLRQVWQWPIDKATFDLNTGHLGSSIRISAASAVQVLSVLREPDPDKRIKLAKLASVRNSMLGMTNSGQALAAITSKETGNLRMPPKPVLTGEALDRAPLSPDVDPEDTSIVLTIVLKKS